MTPERWKLEKKSLFLIFFNFLNIYKEQNEQARCPLAPPPGGRGVWQLNRCVMGSCHTRVSLPVFSCALVHKLQAPSA